MSNAYGYSVECRNDECNHLSHFAMTREQVRKDAKGKRCQHCGREFEQAHAMKIVNTQRVVKAPNGTDVDYLEAG